MAKTRKIIKKTLIPPQAKTLLAWYDTHGRSTLPWRSHDGRAETAYHTWIAEIMLQQTTVAAVIPYYEKFLKRWPTIEALANADEQEVLAAWAGLGYYSRARNLLKCAKIVADDHNGIFPQTIEELKTLPGVGDYTANAIRAIAFDLPGNVVDGNVERVMARVFTYDQPTNTPKAKAELKILAAVIAPQKRPGDYAQALMDLGATICTPKSPKCLLCPWKSACQAFATNTQNEYPKRLVKKQVPQRYTTSLVMQNTKGEFFLVQRPSSGLLGGLWEFPSSPWDTNDTQAPNMDDALAFFGIKQNDIARLETPVRHVFTHMKLDLHLLLYKKKTLPKNLMAKYNALGQWFDLNNLPPLSNLTQKALLAARKSL